MTTRVVTWLGVWRLCNVRTFQKGSTLAIEENRSDSTPHGRPTIRKRIYCFGPCGAFAIPGVLCRIACTRSAVSFLLTEHAESLIRHCARVSWQPQEQVRSLKRRRASFFCSGERAETSTPGSS